MKKILALLAMAPLAAKPYVGVQLGASFLDAQASIRGLDTINPGGGLLASKNFSIKQTAFNFGALAGWSFASNSTFSPFVEIDYNYSGSKKQRGNLDYYDGIGDNFLNNESISVRAKHSIGFMPGLNVKVTEKLSALVGVRLSMTQYEVKAEHTNNAATAPANVVDPLNSATRKAFVMGVEPTIGAKFAFTQQISGRFTVGYLISQRKTVVSNYIGSANAVARGNNAAVSIKPHGVRLNAAVIYSF